MHINVAFTETKQVTKDIELPYYVKDKYGTIFYMVNEDESVMTVHLITSSILKKVTFGGMILETNVSKSMLETIAKAEPSTEEEFEEVICQVIEYLDDKVSKFQTA